jgi:preprotein translocase subunit Sec63
MDIQKSYECLTDQTKFDNWVTYGNPDGSILLQTMDIPLPSFLKNEANQIFVLGGFFITFIMLPVVIILRLKD